MSFCSSPDRKTITLPGSGFGAAVGPSRLVCGPADQLRRQDDVFGWAGRRLDAAEDEVRRLLADLAGADLDGGQRRPVVRRLGDVVEADHSAVAAGGEPAIGERDQDARGADVV